jgi:hypothetical protein
MFSYLAYLAHHVFRNSLMFPFALTGALRVPQPCAGVSAARR